MVLTKSLVRKTGFTIGFRVYTDAEMR